MKKKNDWINRYMTFTQNIETSAIFQEWVAISVLASTLQRKVWLDLGHLVVYPNMYIILIGPPGGARKGTAIKPGLGMLNELGIKLGAESITREQIIRRMVNARTVESLEDNNTIITHSSYTVIAPELTVFLGYNNPKFLSDLTDWFDCADVWRYETKNMGQDEILGVWFNLLGATTPGLLQSALPKDAIGGGLTSRMVFVYSERPNKIIPIPFITPEEKQLREDLLIDLEERFLMKGQLKPTEEFIKAWIDWRYWAEAHRPFDTPALLPYVERRPVILLKLSMIMNAARTTNMQLDVVDLESARELLERTEKWMPKAFSGVGARDDSAILERLMTVIARVGKIDYGILRHKFLFDTDQDQFDKMLQSLESIGYIKQRIGAGKHSIEIIK
jgi:hypothetical protein